MTSREFFVETLKDELARVAPMKAVFDNAYIKNISGPNVKSCTTGLGTT